MAASKKIRIDNFNLRTGRVIARKYEIIERIGEGWEGEVYKIIEQSTGIERAAKVFYPKRNPRDKAAKLYAKKLHKLRNCDIIIQYHTQEEIRHMRHPITVLISEYVEGERLDEFIKRQPGGRLQPFQAVHFLYSLANGIHKIHQLREYHGDLHIENVIINRYGLGFDLKLIDLYHWSTPKRENIQEDIIDMIKLFYEILGGRKYYSNQPENVKFICCGLKRNLILKKFPTTSRLIHFLESMSWN